MNVFVKSTDVDLWHFMPSASTVTCDIPEWVQRKEHTKIEKLLGIYHLLCQPRTAAKHASRSDQSH